jgi:hypothetical protein
MTLDLPMLYKPALLELLGQARKRAEGGDMGIAWQHEIINELELRGLNSDKARALLQRLITAQEVDLTEMERLLDEMDKRE